MVGTTMSPEEIRLAKEWKFKEDLAPSDIAARLNRNKSTITRLFSPRAQRKTRGRRAMLTEVQVDALVAKLKDMIKKANGTYEVTAQML